MAQLRLFKAIRPLPGFHTDEPPTHSRYTAELFAEARPDGRIVDQVRCLVGGSAVFEATFKLQEIFGDTEFNDWQITVQRFPRDIDIRKGLLSTPWRSIGDLAASRDLAIFDEHGAEIPAAEFLRRLKSSDDGPLGAIRWCIVLNDSERLSLQLQGLPSSASTLMGKPSLKRYPPLTFAVNYS